MKAEKLFKDINDLHTANISHAQSTAENAVIIGVKFHQLKEILPHGEFEDAARKATKVSDQTRSRYMLIAEERLVEQRALKLLSGGKSPDGKSSTVELLDGKSFSVKLLDDPDQQAIPVEIRDQARDEVRSKEFKWTALDIKAKDLARGLESTDVMALFRDYKAIRDKKPKQHVAPRQLSPDELIAAENAKHKAALIDIENAIAYGFIVLAGLSSCVPTKDLKQHLRTVVSWTKAIRPLTKRKLSPAEKKQETKAKAKALLAAVESCQAAMPKSGSSDKGNPWLVESMQAKSPGCMTCDAGDRLNQVKASTDSEWLKKVVAFDHTQKTVREAAERRLRMLAKAAANESGDPMPTHSAYVSVRGTLIVETYNPEEENKAAMSPSVVAVIRGVVARNYQEAQSEAARRYRAQEYQKTIAGEQFGMPKQLNY